MTKSIILPVSYAAINSASVDELATVGWNLHLYAIVPPARRMQMPLNDRLVLTQEAQSESEYACAMLALNWGQLSRRMSCLLLWTGGRGPSGSSMRELRVI